MKTLYISDLDGTLLDREGKLSDRSAEILSELSGKGILFSVATARSQSAVGFLDRLNVRIPSVHLNGVLIYDHLSEKYIGCTPIDPVCARKILTVLIKHDRMSFVYKYDDDGGINVEFERLTNDVEREFFEVRKDQDYKSFRQTSEITARDDEKVIYFTMVDEYSRLLPIYREISSLQGAKAALYSDNYSDMYFLEVFSSSASKASGMKRIKELTGADRVVAFGDNMNDIEMLTLADTGAAVEDCVEQVKQYADVIIGKSYEDGVASYILRDIEAQRNDIIPL